MHIYRFDIKDLYLEALKAMQPVNTILDIGCGIVPQRHVITKTHICCEPYKEYVDVLLNERKFSRGKAIVLNMGWEDAVKYFSPNSIDTVVLVDVIEHLEKDDGKDLLNKTIQLAKQQVVLFTPLGFMPQFHEDGKDAWGLGGADWQEHKSGWKPEDFEQDGWEFFISEEYHFYDNLGRKLDKPYGAFWAVFTKNPDKSSLNLKIKKRFRILSVYFRNNLFIRGAIKVKKLIKAWLNEQQ
jgi:hypothetical protein